MRPIFTTPPLQITDVPADKKHTSGIRSLDAIEMIVLHDTGSKKNERIEDTLKWLSTHSRSVVSSHRTIGYDGKIYKHCDDNVIANTVGFSRMGNTKSLNLQSLNIELFRRQGDTEYPMPQLRACVAQCVEWIGLYGLLPILYHSQVDTQGKVDPRNFPRREFDLDVMLSIAYALMGPK